MTILEFVLYLTLILPANHFSQLEPRVPSFNFLLFPCSLKVNAMFPCSPKPLRGPLFSSPEENMKRSIAGNQYFVLQNAFVNKNTKGEF